LGCLVDLAEQTGVITRKGAWYSYNGDNIAQGRDNTVKYLEEHAEFAENVDRQVREQLDMGAVVQANSVTPVDDDDEEEIFEEI
jgi:recombination protein RecA